MKLTDYIKENLHKEHPTLRLNKPFIEPTPQELDKICQFIDLKSLTREPLNPLERLGMDIMLGSIGVDADDKGAVQDLYEYLEEH